MEEILHDLVSDLEKHVKRIKQKQDELDLKLKEVQRQQQYIKRTMEENEGITILGYANLNNIQICDDCISYLSRKAVKISMNNGYRIGIATHPVYGKVNTYHVDVLDMVFDEEFCSE